MSQVIFEGGRGPLTLRTEASGMLNGDSQIAQVQDKALCFLPVRKMKSFCEWPLNLQSGPACKASCMFVYKALCL